MSINNYNGFSFLICLLFCGHLNAQKAVSATGGEGTGSGGTVSFTIGQIDFINTANSSYSINQGVQQPYEFFTVEVEKIDNICLQTNVYPNPTSSTIYLRIDIANLSGYSCQLKDLTGKLLQTLVINNTLTEINLNNMCSGIYTLSVIESNKIIQTIKIIKN